MVETFSYLGFEGPIRMSGADEQFTVFEQYSYGTEQVERMYLGRLIGKGSRDLVNTYTLKKRQYIATTSMDSELALIGANLALAAPNKLFYDPFIGTGSLPIACSHFGALALGSDMDGRCLRGKNRVNVKSSFAQYGLEARYMGGFTSDLTHSPLRHIQGGWLDGIVCDPPYGIREGLRVLGVRGGGKKEVHYVEGKPAHLFVSSIRCSHSMLIITSAADYVPPKQQYSFEAMLIDILSFAAETLVENGRLSMWMPTANDEDQEIAIPAHGALEVVSNCIQPFNKCRT